MLWAGGVRRCPEQASVASKSLQSRTVFPVMYNCAHGVKRASIDKPSIATHSPPAPTPLRSERKQCASEMWEKDAIVIRLSQMGAPLSLWVFESNRRNVEISFRQNSVDLPTPEIRPIQNKIMQKPHTLHSSDHKIDSKICHKTRQKCKCMDPLCCSPSCQLLYSEI